MTQGTGPATMFNNVTQPLIAAIYHAGNNKAALLHGFQELKAAADALSAQLEVEIARLGG